MKNKYIKYTLNHFNTGEAYALMPVSTEVTIEADEATPTLSQTIIHRFRGENGRDQLESRKDLVISDPKVIQAFEAIDLRNLKTDYSTDEGPERWETWIVKYNGQPEIKGTSDQEPEPIAKLKEILSFDENYNKIRAEIEQAGEQDDKDLF